MVISRCSREIESDSDKMATCEEFDCEGSEIDDEVLLCAAAAATSVLLGCVRKAAARKKRRVWARGSLLERPRYGAYSQLLQELFCEDQKEVKRFLRLSKDSFDEVLERVGRRIAKQHTPMRRAIEPGERLAITLRYLGSGDSFISLSYLFRVGDNTIRKIVLETCEAIYEELKDDYLKVPSTADEWQGLADEFEQRWQFPNCIGAIDGKHIQICSPGGGSDYFNYQSYNSIILLALVDAKYCITWFSVGCNGRAGDAAVFSQSSLAECMEDKENRLGIPAPKPLPGRVDPVPYVIVGDDAFGLKPYMMKPYPFKSTLTSSGAATDPAEIERRKQRLFDYRLSRARRLSENVFGILVAKFGVFQRTMRLSPDNATTVSLACVALHNFLMRRKDNLFAHPRLTDREHPVTRENIGGEWRQNQHTALRAIDRQAGNHHSADARWVRNELKEFVQCEGTVPWQERLVFGRDLA
ncbi:hypothetical protein ACOMHN_020286 [Nucella lapillus]